MEPINSVDGLHKALVQGSYFAVTKDGGLETISTVKNFLRDIFSTGSGAMKREKDILLAMSELFGPAGIDIDNMSGPVELDTLNQKTRDIVVPYDKLADAKNRIARMFVTEEFSIQDLIDDHKFSPADAASLHQCLLDNINSGFFRPLLKDCVDPYSIVQCLGKLVEAAKTEKGAFLLGFKTDNGFPQIWQDIKDTKLRDSYNLKADRILGQAFKEFETWTKSDLGRTANKLTMASWVENSCPEIRAAILAYPRDHGYAAYHGLVDDKMRLGRLFQDDPNGQRAIAFALSKLEDIRNVQPKGELTIKSIWRGCFGNEPMLPEAEGEAFSLTFGRKVDRWLLAQVQDHLMSVNQGMDTLSLMRRMVLEFKPEDVGDFVLKASDPDRPRIVIGSDKMIDANATLTLAPKKGEKLIESLQRDILLRPLVERRNQNWDLVPSVPTINIPITNKNNIFTVGDISQWGEPSVKNGENGRTTTFKHGPKTGSNGDINIALSDDDIVKYMEGKDSDYASSIVEAVQYVCRGNSDKQFDAVMRHLTNASMGHMFSDTGLLHGLPDLNINELTAVDMRLWREYDGSATVTVKSSDSSYKNRWGVNFSLTVNSDGLLQDSSFYLVRDKS